MTAEERRMIAEEEILKRIHIWSRHAEESGIYNMKDFVKQVCKERGKGEETP